MMKLQTVDQLLLVLRLFREHCRRGTPLRKAYQAAVRSVAEQYGVTYQTIGDGCRRRLRLNEINELYVLLELWMKGDSRPLARQLRAVSESSSHDVIESFFGFTNTGPERPLRDLENETTEAEFDIFSFRLPKREARLLRALSELKGVSVPNYLALVVGSAAQKEMARIAREFAREAEADGSPSKNLEEVLGILRDHEAQLRALGIERVSVFGSAARRGAQSPSDVDLAVTLAPDFPKGLDYLARMEIVRVKLSQLLGCKVDLVEEPVEKTELQRQIDEDRAVAF